jgi:flagellar protein FlgJ
MEILGLTNTAMAQLQIQRQSGEAKSEVNFQAALDNAMENKDKEQLRKACIEFESYFVHMMFKEMRKSVDSSSGIFPKGQAETIFQDMLDEEVAKAIANGRGIGLADMMFRQMKNNI